MYRITDAGNYYQVEINGSTREDLMEAILAAADFPGYLERPAIWIFGEKSYQIQLKDLQDIAIHARTQYAAVARVPRRAIVVSPGLNAGYAEIYAQDINLPYELKIFHGLKGAEDWVLS